MTTEQEDRLRASVTNMINRKSLPEYVVSFLIGFIGEAEKQAAIDALAKAETFGQPSEEAKQNSHIRKLKILAESGVCGERFNPQGQGRFREFLRLKGIQLYNDYSGTECEEIAIEYAKEVAIDALAKAERIQEVQEMNELPIPSSEYDRYLNICSRCGTLSAYLVNFIDKMTPDQREIIAIQFDQNLFGTDEAMAKRFRDANNKDTINN